VRRVDERVEPWHGPCLVVATFDAWARRPPAAPATTATPEEERMPNETTTVPLATPGKYLCFVLGGTEYGLAIPRIVEIRGLSKPVRLPRTPACMRGVIGLRGRTVPVVDLRRKFRLPPGEETERSCVIVVEVARDDRRVVLGLLADDVAEVLSLSREQIAPAPARVGRGGATDAIAGRGTLGGKVVTLLDVDHLLESGELDAMAQAAGSPRARGRRGTARAGAPSGR
jgi:purine-binding chemotaxis protein CheW